MTTNDKRATDVLLARDVLEALAPSGSKIVVSTHAEGYEVAVHEPTGEVRRGVGPSLLYAFRAALVWYRGEHPKGKGPAVYEAVE